MHIPSGLVPRTSMTAFSWAAWIGGFVVALVVGAFANLIFGIAALTSGHPAGAALVELIPGVAIVFIAWRARWNDGFSQGMIVGGCIIALVGGMCGFMLR